MNEPIASFVACVMSADLERQMLLDEEKRIQEEVAKIEAKGGKPKQEVIFCDLDMSFKRYHYFLLNLLRLKTG